MLPFKSRTMHKQGVALTKGINRRHPNCGHLPLEEESLRHITVTNSANGHQEAEAH